MSRKWIAYGTTGVLGVAALAGGAIAAAHAMDLRTTSGHAVAAGAITSGSEQRTAAGIDSGRLQLSAPTPGEQPSAATPNSTAGPSAHSAATPGEKSAVSAPDQTAEDDTGDGATTQPAQKTQPAAKTEPAPVTPPAASPVSPVSAGSAASAGSN